MEGSQVGCIRVVFPSPQAIGFPDNVLCTRSTVILNFSYLPIITIYLVNLKLFEHEGKPVSLMANRH